MSIHPSAIIDPRAKIHETAVVGPFCVIGPDVTIGPGNQLANNVTIQGRTEIGPDNRIGAFATLGMPAQDKTNRDDDCQTLIGQGNDIREYVSVHRGTDKGGGITRIGDFNQIFVYSHFAHDTQVGSKCMFANCTTLAGHVIIGDCVVTGGFAGFHQFTRVGSYCMIGAMSALFQDAPPYVICTGPRAQAKGINLIGLQRNGFDETQTDLVQEVYNRYFCSGLIPAKALAAVEEISDNSELFTRFIDFGKTSKRGLVTRG